MFEKILFDLDGTLTDPKVGITKSVQYALKHYGIEVDADKLTPFIGPPLVTSFMEFYGFEKDRALEAVGLYREYFGPIGKFENEVYDGIPELLKELKKMGIVLAIASSKPEQFVIDILKHFDLYDYFDVITGSLMNETRTTKEEVLEEAMKRLGVTEESDKGKIAMVGDRKFDIIGAKYYGLVSVGVRFGYAEEGELEAENPNFIANTVEDLKRILLG